MVIFSINVITTITSTKHGNETKKKTTKMGISVVELNLEI